MADHRLAIYYSNGWAFNPADIQVIWYCSQYRVIEYNGDGRSDLLCIDSWHAENNDYQVPAYLYVYESTPTGWVYRGTPAMAQYDPDAAAFQVLTGDVNGDGLTDLISSETNNWQIRLATGSGYAPPTSVGGDAQSQPTSLTLGTFANMDDDQALELVVPWLEGGGFFQGVAVFRYDPSSSGLNRYITLTGLNVVARGVGVPGALKPLPDLNGDGLPDLVYEKSNSAHIHTRLNTGSGFGAEEQSGVPTVHLNSGRYVDANNDGRDDLVVPDDEVAGTWAAFHSSGTTFGSWGTALAVTGASALQFADVTGDGHSDAVFAVNGEWWYVHPHLADIEAVTVFWDGKGNRQQVTYQPLSTLSYFYNWSTPSLPATRQYRGPLMVVDQVEANSGIGMQSYSYATGVVGPTFLTRYWYWDAMVDNRGRGFLGFGWFRTKDYRRDYHVDQTFHHQFPRTGWPILSVRETSTGADIDEYDPASPVVTSMGAGRYFVHIDQETFREYELNQQLIRTISRARTFNTTSGALDLETVTTQAPSGATYTTTTDVTLQDLGACLGLPDLVSVTRSAPNVPAKTRTVDNVFLPTCRVSTSTNTSETAAGMQLKTSYTYDNAGNTKTITLNDAGNTAGQERKTEFFYEMSGHLFHLPSSIKRYISGESEHTESLTWDYKLALPLTRTEAVDGPTTRWTYNDLGRLTREELPDGSYTDFGINMGYVGHMANSIPAHTTYGSDGSSTWEYVDSYGRVVGTQTRLTPSWSRTSTQRFFYDEAGNLDAETQPFILGDPEYQIGYQHDSLGRVQSSSRDTSEQNGIDAVTAWTYNGLTTSVTTPGNPYNQTTTTIRDAIGRTVQVTDSALGVSYYEYNAFDQLTKSTDPAGHFTSIGYNNRGDKEDLWDPDLGHWEYEQYNVFGELTRVKDAKSQTVLFKYDQLGRLDWRTEPEFPNGPGPDDDGKTDFTYYTTGDFKHGLPKDEIFPGGTFQRTYTYDNRRRVLTETTTVDGTARTTDFAYHPSGAAQGKLQYITYPTSTSSIRVKLESLYDGVGALWKINDVTSGGGFNAGTIYQLDYTDALLRETSATLGNGAIPTARVFDRANLALKSIQTGTGNAIQNLQYDWYANGNLKEINDIRIGRVDAFTYDGLGRLDTQSLNGGQILNLDYTPGGDGNLSFKTGVGTYAAYGGSSGGPHAVTSITGLQSNTYTYDANGNMTNRDGDAITWFSHNRPKKINYGSSSSEFWYGTDRSRYKHVAVSGGSTVTTRYFGPHFEVETRGSLTIYRHYVFAGGQAVAQIERRSSGSPANDIQYLHRDHLASVVATTSAAGAVRQRFEYDAFGWRTRSFGSGADDTERGYTGHEHLDAVELTHMNGRVQDPELGRFISADPFVQAPYQSQSLNRYSYVWNNPLALIDPSGFCYEAPLNYVGGEPNAAEWKSALSIQGMLDQCDFDYPQVEPDDGLLFDREIPADTSGGGTPQGLSEIVVPGSPFGLSAADAQRLSELHLGHQIMAMQSGYYEGPREYQPGEIIVPGATQRYYLGLDPVATIAARQGLVMTSAMVATTAFGAGGGGVTAVPRGTVAGGVGRGTSQILHRTTQQLASKFKHAHVFGVAGNYSKANAAAFSRAIHQHINSPGVHAIPGTYHRQPVTHYLAPSNGLNVMADPAGNFISGWRLSPAQLQNVLTHGGL